jgi:Amt family ammonium transporter
MLQRRSAGKTAGFLFQKGALDFAGGTVVHINAAVAGLVGAFMIGKRSATRECRWRRTA